MNAIDIEDYATRYLDAMAAELRAERARQELTLEAIANEAGMQIKTVQRYLKGERDIPFTRLRAICAALKVSPVELMVRVEKRIG